MNTTSGGASTSHSGTRLRHPAKLLPAGSDYVRIFGRAPGPFTVAWRNYEDGPLRRTTRASWRRAKALAERKQIELSNLAREAEQITPAEAEAFHRCEERAAKMGMSLELALDRLAEFREGLEDGVTEAEVKRFWLENRPLGFKVRPVPELVDEFLLAQEKEISDGWHNHLRHDLGRFVEQFKGPLHAVRAMDLNAWLRGLKVGPRTRHNYRAAVEQLVRWARANGYLPRTWSEMEEVPAPGLKPVEVRIFSPEELAKLFNSRVRAEGSGRGERGLVQWLAVQAFAGLRHAEADRLDWRDVHLTERYIYVQARISKTGNDRVVPMTDALAAWLLAGARPSGRLCPIVQTSGALTKAKREAGLPAGRNESRNVLRKSWISYRLAVTQNIAQVAEEAGNSPGVIRRNYKRPIPAAEGARWFDLWPTQGEILQLNFAGI